MVYVISKSGKPLMPTERRGKVRHLLKDGLAKVVKMTPFTIQLLYDSKEYVQPINLGVDAGTKVIGISASTRDKELFAAEVHLRTDVTELISTRREARRRRRGRKTRYREPRFLNRTKTKKKGWLPPSIEHKINSHIKMIKGVCDILPVKQIIIETAQFDIQKINNPEIKGKEYQEGPQLGFSNVREYVLYRDRHQCQGRKNCKNKNLHIHHIESRKTGGNAPNNLITLCTQCHDDFHKGILKLDFKRGKSFKDASHMNNMRKTLLLKTNELFPDICNTYGYITKFNRIQNNLEKTHINDARCISGNFKAKFIDHFFFYKFVRKNNRHLHKMKFLKGGIRKANKAPHIVHGFRLFDKVSYKGITCFIFARRLKGDFKIRTLDGTVIRQGASFRKLKLLETAKTLLIERKTF